MKRLLIYLLLLTLTLPSLYSCTNKDDERTDTPGEVTMIAEIEKIGEKIEVTVTESEYTSGVHLVIVNEKTQYVDKDGNKISKDMLAPGQIIEILYSGQVMLSYPPQIVAKRITIL